MDRSHLLFLYLVLGCYRSSLRAHSTILEQLFGFHHKLPQFVIGTFGIILFTGDIFGDDVGHILRVRSSHIFFLILIKLVDFLFCRVKQVSEDLVFMFKGILRVFAGSFFQKDTLVLAGYRLCAWNRDTLGLLAGYGVLQLGGFDIRPKLWWTLCEWK